MSDANVVGRWVTDAGDARIGDGYTCWRLHGPSCGIGLSAPFYEPLGPRHPTETLCPACALTHFGVRPPGTEATECGHAADDRACSCWGVWFRRASASAGSWASASFSELPLFLSGLSSLCCNRQIAQRCADGANARNPGWAYEARRHDTGCHAPGTNVCHVIAASPTAIALPAPSRCHLDWCSAPTRGTFCSSNCERAHEDRIAATTKLAVFRRVIAEKEAQMPLGAMAECDMAGEVKWAERHTDEEIETIRRAWSALRHAAAEGNEGAFASTGDEP